MEDTKRSFFDWNYSEWKAFFSAIDSMAGLGFGKSPEERAIMIAKCIPEKIPVTVEYTLGE